MLGWHCWAGGRKLAGNQRITDSDALAIQKALELMDEA
jgi:hypothetical protein